MRKKRKPKGPPIVRPVRTELPETNQEIIRIKTRFALSDKAMAQALRVAPNTVRSWIRQPGENNFRKAPRIAAKAAQDLEERLMA